MSEEMKNRQETLAKLVEAHGFDKVSSLTGLKLSSLINYVRPGTKITIGKNTLRLLELELIEHDIRTN